MIKINLCPVEELENPHWYALDVAVLVLLAVGSYIAVQQHLDEIRQRIVDLDGKTSSFEQSYAQLQPELEQFKTLNEDIAKLNTKLTALQSITVSKISKYKPVVVIEHLQNLKPDGVWFQTVKYGLDGAEGTDSFEIKGQAFDNILTAELMTGIRATESQEYDSSDVRSQIFFQGMSLEETAVQQGAPAGFAEMVGFPEFTIKGQVRERTGATPAAAGAPGVAGLPAAPNVLRF